MGTPDKYRIICDGACARPFDFELRICKNIGMRSILCFGDSNTYGYIPGGFGRYPFEKRWPGALEMLLAPDWRVIEEGLCGRTTVFREADRPWRAAIDYMAPCAATHRPFDLAAVMLGTNDCKCEFGASADIIAQGLVKVLRVLMSEVYSTTRVLVIAPPPLCRGQNCGGDFGFDENSRAVSLELAEKFAKAAGETGCLFFDAASVASASPTDSVHMDKESHIALARAVAEIVRREFG